VNRKPFKDTLREWREAQELSQEEAGARVGATQSAWSRWEKGEGPSSVVRHAIEREILKAGGKK